MSLLWICCIFYDGCEPSALYAAQSDLAKYLPKVLAVLGIAVALWIVLGFEKSDTTSDAVDIDCRRLHEYKLGQALILLGLMVAYALLLRHFGFLGATFGFCHSRPLFWGNEIS